VPGSWNSGQSIEDAIQMIEQQQWIERRIKQQADRRQSGSLFALLLAVSGAGCSTASLTSETPVALKEKIVAERAEARWQAVIRRDFEAAYGYLSPSSRSALTLEGFKATAGQLAYRGAKIDGVTCEAETCDVKLFVTYDHRVMKGVTSPLAEKWILDKGQMWYVWPM
jgi:hypothetical protein